MPEIENSRRRFLALGGRGALVAAAWPVLQGLAACGGESAEEPNRLVIPLAELPDGARQRHLLAEVPLEIRREGERITARSLLCTHQGCEVSWQPDRQRYFCPCHDGTFDAEGQVTGGPPPRPLRSYPVRRRDDVVIIGE
jgi:cytochrome b6-f complex iron-sulfur subunit